MKIIEVTPGNAKEETLFCVKDITNPGFEYKQKWLEKSYEEGLRIKILKDDADRMIGFIEYVPTESAWRPVDADKFMFIHCMYVYSKKDRNKGYGSRLINEAINEGKARGMNGVCVMTSKGSMMAEKKIFRKNGFQQIAEKDRFQLLSKKWDTSVADPKFRDWTAEQKKYQGWHLVYADQCPWHNKSAEALLNTAMDYGVHLKVSKLKTPKEAKNAPSGYGVFSLLHNGRLLEDHYLSATRFRNILEKELQRSEPMKS